MSLAVGAVAACVIAAFIHHLCFLLFFSPLSRIPGPRLFAWTGAKLAYEDYKGTRTRKIHSIHVEYGPVVRIGPNEVSFNSISALRTIYGAGSGFQRTGFYKMFEAYGRKNMFSFSTVKEHGERKKLFAHAYAKSVMIKGDNATMVEQKAKLYLELLEKDGPTSEIFSTLHYFSIDNITEFLYGKYGKTSCLEGSKSDRELIEDIIDVSRRRLSWYSVHFPGFTKWLYAQNGILGCVTSQFYPMQKPTTYSGIRNHAMKACQKFGSAPDNEKINEKSLIARLWNQHASRKDGGLDDLDIASECADHLLAGIDTTSDTLMFLIWSLSRPQNTEFQKRLIEVVKNIPERDLNADGIPKTDACDKLPYVDAVIKETLRLYAPLPGSEPRSLPTATTIDGYSIPAGTTVSIAPYTLHRNPEVFVDPLKFNPDRWLESSADSVKMKQWFWAFSSGGRMCIGMQ
jgi:hypothetical protein